MRMQNYNKELLIKVLILIILILLILVTSFRSGEKFYILQNTYFGNSTTKVESGLARWKFEARIIYLDWILTWHKLNIHDILWHVNNMLALQLQCVL